MSVCIFPGKFQPFHNGHLMVVEGMVKTCPRVVIAICHGAKDALFGREQVREMITGALLSENIIDAMIVTVEDAADDAEWVKRVLESAEAGNDAQVWSGKPEVLALFESAGIATKKISPVPGIDSEHIREMIESGNSDWRKSVSGSTVDVVTDYLERKNR